MSFFLIFSAALAHAERLPTVNSDSNNWGTVLNNFLLLEHTTNGTHKNVTINGTLGVNTTNPAQTLTVQGTLNVTPAGQGSNASLFVTSGGNVGIGTTGPSATLHINSSSAQGALLVTNGSGSNYTALFVNATLGNIGIGTTAPLANLHIKPSSGNSELRLDTSAADTNSILIFYENAGDKWSITNVGASSDILRFTSGSTSNILVLTQAGNVGIGTTSPQNALDVVGAVTVSKGLNASNLNVTGFSITDDSLVTLSDGTKKKIKDIKAGEEVLTLDEKTSKLVPRKVNALLDHGIKPIYEMVTEDGRAINTTAEHPYFVKYNSHIPANLENNKSRISPVLNTLTLDCFLNASSSDQIAPSEANARAKYCTSLLCGESLSASSANILNSLNGRKSTSSLMNLNTLTSSSDGSLLLSTISSRCLPISKNKYSGDISQSELRILFNKNTSNALPFDSNAEKTLLASTTKNIYNQLLIESLNLCANDLSTFSDSSATSFSVNLLLDTIDFNSSNFSNFCLISLLTTNDQFTLNSSISSFNSLGKDTFNSNSSILASQSSNNENDYLKLSNNTALGEWIEVRYLEEGMEIAVPDYSKGAIKWEKIASIKTLEPQHVYDLSIEGTRNFIANDIIAHNTYLATSSGNVGIGTAVPAQTLTVQGRVNISQNLTVNNSVLFVDGTSGSVGIGTTSPGELLELETANPLLRFNDTDNPNWWNIGAVGDDFKIYLNDTSADGITIDQDGSVGIGTTGPAATLHINSSSAQGALLVTNGSGSNYTALFVNATSGNVGIGTMSPTVLLDVAGKFKFVTPAQETYGSFDATTANQGWMSFAQGGTIFGYLGQSSGLVSGGLTTDMAIRGVNNIVFSIEGAEAMRVGSAGRVGIGTTAPNNTLDVRGKANFTGNFTVSGTGPILFVDNTSGRVGIGTTAPNAKLVVIGGANISGGLNVSAGNVLLATESGNVGINITNPKDTLHVNGTFNVTRTQAGSNFAVKSNGVVIMDNLATESASTDFNINANNELHKVTSSKRFKEGIKDIELDTDLIYDLLPRTFVWNNESGSYGKTDFGLVAEEVDEIIPDLVSYDSSGEPYSVKYQMLTVLLLKEIQDLKKETDRIKAGGNLAEFKNINGSIIVRLG